MSFDKENIKLKQGINNISLKIENPGLTIGEYSMIFYMYNKMKNVIFWVENCSNFQISNLSNVILANSPVKSHLIPKVKVINK